MSDKRAEILSWLDMMDQHFAAGGVWKDYGLALKALRSEVVQHEQMPEWRNDEDRALGIQLQCYCEAGSTRTSWPCEFIRRIYGATVGSL